VRRAESCWTAGYPENIQEEVESMRRKQRLHEDDRSDVVLQELDDVKRQLTYPQWKLDVRSAEESWKIGNPASVRSDIESSAGGSSCTRAIAQTGRGAAGTRRRKAAADVPTAEARRSLGRAKLGDWRPCERWFEATLRLRAEGSSCTRVILIVRTWCCRCSTT